MKQGGGMTRDIDAPCQAGGNRQRSPINRLLRRAMPRSLFGRSLLMIVLPVLLLLTISTFLFYNRHWDNVTRHMALSAAGDIALTIDILGHFPPGPDRERLLEFIRSDTRIGVEFLPGAILPNTPPPIGDTILERMLAQSLTQVIYRPFHLDATGNREFVSVRIQLQDGILSAHIPRKRVSSATTYIFILWMVGVSLVLTLVALIFLRNQMRSIRRLAMAADSFGKGRDVTHFKPEGASEIRQAAHAFLRMRDRIHRQITQRTEMLAGVSHDLRTPLTRMKLQLALMPQTDDINELRADVNEMERMVEGYLAFARGEGADESAEVVDLADLARSVVERAPGHGRRPALSWGRQCLCNRAAPGAETLPEQHRRKRLPVRRPYRRHPACEQRGHRHLHRRRRTGHSARTARRSLQAVQAPCHRRPWSRAVTPPTPPTKSTSASLTVAKESALASASRVTSSAATAARSP